MSGPFALYDKRAINFAAAVAIAAIVIGGLDGSGALDVRVILAPGGGGHDGRRPVGDILG